MGATQNRLCRTHQDQIMTQSPLKEMQVRSLPHTNTPPPASRDVSFEVDVLKFMCRSPGMWTMADVQLLFKGEEEKSWNSLPLLQPQLALHFLLLEGEGLLSAAHQQTGLMASSRHLTLRWCSPPKTEPALGWQARCAQQNLAVGCTSCCLGAKSSSAWKDFSKQAFVNVSGPWGCQDSILLHPVSLLLPGHRQGVVSAASTQTQQTCGDRQCGDVLCIESLGSLWHCSPPVYFHG